jgi:hypothetical protein
VVINNVEKARLNFRLIRRKKMLYTETVKAIESFGHSIDDIDFAVISDNRDWDKEKKYVFSSAKEFAENAERLLSFEYDSGYGSQEVGGVIVFNDGTWMERREYDGSEWWESFKTPQREKIIGGQE